MQKLKLGFTDTHEHLASFFFEVLSSRYDIEISDTPDFLIFGDRNFGENNKNFSRKDCTKIFYTGENQRPEDYDCDYAISFDHNFYDWHYRLPLYVIYMWALDRIHKTPFAFNSIYTDIPAKPKTDFCSFVVSNPGCPERNEFFNKLNAKKHVDSGGRFMNNTGADLKTEMDKINFLSTRKFNICFEPYAYPGYTTEKILHAFYAKTIPIYWGNPFVDLDFNPKAFINVQKFNSYEECIEEILELNYDEKYYNLMLNEPPLMYNIPTQSVRIVNFLNWFDAVVYKRILGRHA